MKKEIIEVTKTFDRHQCELCGDDYQESTCIKYGNWTYGKEAYAHCYNSTYTEYDEAFDALIKHLGLPEILLSEERPYATESDYLIHLRELGFTVEVENIEPDDSYYQDEWDDYDEDDS